VRQLAVLLMLLAAAPVSAAPTLKASAAERRAKLLRAIPDGILVVQSADRSQPNLLEFMVPDTENHDFIYLTGVDRVLPPGSTLVLNPHGETYREILYTADDVETMKQATGIAHVFPARQFLDDLSSALTDYRNLRITQLRFKPAASDISRGLGVAGVHKVIYWNYPRFTNLAEPNNPRLALVARLKEASPEVDVRDAGELLDRARMIHDEYEIEQLREAVRVTGKGLTEAMKAARPGAGTNQIAQTMDFIYRLNGGDLGFDTAVSAGPAELPVYATAREEFAARARGHIIKAGEIVHADTGAAINHYSADIQRVVPADGHFTPEQKAFYNVVLGVQKAVIDRVVPGAKWWDLHNLAVQMLKDAGGLDKTYTYGIGHFIGMEVHDHGDYLGSLEPGMVLAIEQGAIKSGTRIAFEDDVLVTATGHEWLSRSIPIEIEEIERLMAQPPVIDPAKFMVRPGGLPPR
jgi:Xaa-Pro aminopeptidase